MQQNPIEDGIKFPEKKQKIKNEEIKELENNIIKIIKKSDLKDATKEHILNQKLTFADYEYDIPIFEEKVNKIKKALMGIPA